MASSRLLPDAFTEKTYRAAAGDYAEGEANNWVADRCESADFPTASSGEVLTIYNDQAFYDDDLQASGSWTQDNNYFPVVRGQDPASKPEFRQTWNDTSNHYTWFIEEGMRIYDVKGRAANSNAAAGVTAPFCMFPASGEKGVFVGCISTGDSTGDAADNAYGFFIQPTGTSILVNNAVGVGTYTGASSIGFFVWQIGAGNSMYNNTCAVDDVAACFYALTGATTSKNNVAQDATGSPTYDFYEDPTFGGTFNQTTDASSQSLDIGADGYTLNTADGNGTDLSGDGTYPFDDDINGVTRTTWDRGADFAAAASSGTSIYSGDFGLKLIL